MLTTSIIKKSNEPSQAQLREKRIAERQAKIKQLVEQIERSKLRQADLIHQISIQQRQVEQRDNAIADPNLYSSVDIDIRNSQLVSSVQIQRKRWLQAQKQQIFEVLGEEEQLKAKFQQLQLQEKPLEKAKLIKMMKRKVQLFQGLTKLKPDSGLYLSHQRVLLKQCLQDIREMNGELEDFNKRYENVDSQYLRGEAKLKNTVSDLKQVVGVSSYSQ